jgi:putative salt-induced outer membrane protein
MAFGRAGASGYTFLVGFLTFFTILMAPSAHAQAPAVPVKAWTVTVSGGVALTNGNRDTSTLNAGYEMVYDPQAKNLVKSDALFLRGKSDGELSTDRLGVNARDEYQLMDRAFVFGQLQFVRDRFKRIDYLWAPTTGFGYRLVDSEVTRISIDTGLGGVWEKDPGSEVKVSGAISIAEKLSHQISDTAAVTQSASALYKTDDFADALYVAGFAVTSSLTQKTQIKVEVVDTYKNRVILPAIVNNDVALVVSFAYKH